MEKEKKNKAGTKREPEQSRNTVPGTRCVAKNRKAAGQSNCVRLFGRERDGAQPNDAPGSTYVGVGEKSGR